MLNSKNIKKIKYLFILISILLFTNCNSYEKREIVIPFKDINNYESNNQIVIYLIDSCEYISFKQTTTLVHKANCINSIHYKSIKNVKK